ncbi:MAG TPA: TetR family transcriptional regulator [Streptosporangiaceae bacterium]|nr:TetR family transcriptional regulator [Streptosporangiaceae bacterium]
MDAEESLRERKRRESRKAIAHAAMRLFAERGFDQVSVADIAIAAGVAEKTVYNYFPVKAEIFFDEAGDILAELLAAVRYRSAGQSALDAVATFVAGRREWAAGRRPEQPTSRFRQLIADSAALQSQQRLMFGRYETALAQLLAEETGVPAGSAEPFVAAVALVGVLRAAFETSAGGQKPGRDQATAALDVLAGGLASYAVAPQ